MDRTLTVNHVFSKTFAARAIVVLCTVAIAGLASPARAEPETSTKLVRCGAESCLRISGYRPDPGATVRINGHAVPVEGERRWQVQLPVEVVREWSEAYARTIEVSLHQADAQIGASADVELPVGMLGGPIDLSSLVISVY